MEHIIVTSLHNARTHKADSVAIANQDLREMDSTATVWNWAYHQILISELSCKHEYGHDA